MGLIVGVILSWTHWRRTGHILLGLCTLLALIVSVVPVGKGMIVSLENRFPMNLELPEKVDGIIVLGGIVNETITKSRGQITVGGTISRLIEFATLSKKFPEAKLVFTGGSGKLLNQDIKEADVLEPLLDVLGVDKERMIFENKSRNTYENATLTKALINPGRNENWILITSAFHMPRSMGVFRKTGWNVIPYPVDYSFAIDEPITLNFSLESGLKALSYGLHEWLGLIFYRLNGKTDHFFPAP